MPPSLPGWALPDGGVLTPLDFPDDLIIHEDYRQDDLSQPWPGRFFTPSELGRKRRAPFDFTLMVSREFILKLDQLREAWGQPLYVTSGYRSPTYNTLIDGSTRSYHMRGQAADIAMPLAYQNQFATLARSTGFGGVSSYGQLGFVHVDTGPVRTW